MAAVVVVLLGALAASVNVGPGTLAAVGAVQATPLRTLGERGHAGLYAWGAATLRDGSVLFSDYWNRRVVHYGSDGTDMGTVVGPRSGAAGHQAPYGVAVDPRNDDLYFGDVDANATVDKYNLDGSLERQFGGRGTGANRFIYPAYVAVASDGRVFVSDSRDHTISIHSDTGGELCSFGGLGTADGRVANPRGIAVDAQDRVYVVDTHNHRVQVFDRDGTFLHKFGEEGTEPGQFSRNLRGITVDKVRGWVYVVDAGSGWVNKYDLAGNYLLRFGGPGTEPGQFVEGGRSPTVDGDGNVWVADMPGFQAQKFSPDGVFLQAVPSPPEPPPEGGFNGAAGVAVDGAGNVFVSDRLNQRVQKLAPDGTFLLEWGDRGRSEFGFNYPRGVATDPVDGRVVVADTDNGSVKKYTSDGEFLWARSGLKGRAVDVGPDQRVYVANAGGQRVVVLSPDGALLRAFGSPGTGDGQFLVPYGISVDPVDETIWVTDQARGDVQHFGNDGRYLGKLATGGPAEHQLADAADVETDASRVYVADAAANKVKVWSKAGVFQGAFGGAGTALGRLRNPQGLHLRDDELYVVETGNERVSVFRVAR